MNYLKWLLIILFVLTGSVLFGQDETSDIDSLFENAEDIQDDRKAEKETAVARTTNGEEEDILQDLVKKEKFHFGTNVNVFLGYSPGWKYLPWIQENDGDPVFTDSAILGISSKMTFDAQIGDNFRVLQSYNIASPDFEPVVSEFFVDFDFDNIVYLRIGRQNLTWGISRYYPFTNLPDRLPDNFGTNNNDDLDDDDSSAIKMDIPIGTGGLQGLIYMRNGYFSDPEYPSMDEIGWGGYYNLALKQADTTVGTFFQKDMNQRGFASVSTTLFNKLELYSEWLVSYDQNKDDIFPEENPDPLDFGANIGFLINLFSDSLEISSEYYYNGEETELESSGTQFPFFWGHNIGAGISLKMYKKKLKLYTLLKYNINENSGIIIPAVSFDSLQFMKLTLSIPIIIGSDNGGYAQNNPDPNGRHFSFILTAKISRKI